MATTVRINHIQNLLKGVQAAQQQICIVKPGYLLMAGKKYRVTKVDAMDDVKVGDCIIYRGKYPGAPGTMYHVFSHDQTGIPVAFDSQNNIWDYLVPADVEPPASDSTPAVQVLPCATGHRDEHWVNIGFMTLKLACKHCGIDQPVPPKRRPPHLNELAYGDILYVVKDLGFSAELRAGNQVEVIGVTPRDRSVEVRPLNSLVTTVITEEELRDCTEIEVTG